MPCATAVTGYILSFVNSRFFPLLPTPVCIEHTPHKYMTYFSLKTTQKDTLSCFFVLYLKEAY